MATIHPRVLGGGDGDGDIRLVDRSGQGGSGGEHAPAGVEVGIVAAGVAGATAHGAE